MSMVDVSLGLRASELFGLRWEDFDWKGLRVKIQRSWVYGRVESTKTEGSEKWLPLDRKLVDILRRHREGMPDALLQTGWVFVSPFTGKPWWAHKVVRYHLRPAADLVIAVTDSGVCQEGYGKERPTRRSAIWQWTKRYWCVCAPTPRNYCIPIFWPDPCKYRT
jgi:hypothetical protein